MRIKAGSPEEYIAQLPEERQKAMNALRKVILDNLPDGFSETMNYGMIGYVVPHTLYPPGYHSDPKQPLPFMNIASQKNYIALYHSGIYADKRLLEWFTETYRQYNSTKPDMGKSCIRFKKPAEIPFQLIGDLVSKLSAEEWINIYEKALKQ